MKNKTFEILCKVPCYRFSHYTASGNAVYELVLLTKYGRGIFAKTEPNGETSLKICDRFLSGVLAVTVKGSYKRGNVIKNIRPATELEIKNFYGGEKSE